MKEVKRSKLKPFKTVHCTRPLKKKKILLKVWIPKKGIEIITVLWEKIERKKSCMYSVHGHTQHAFPLSLGEIC